MDLSERDMLNYALQNGIIDVNTIRAQVEMDERKRLLKKHNSSVWEGTDGKWRTYFPTEDGGRKLVKRTNEEAIYDAIVDFWRDHEENPQLKDVFKLYNDTRLANGQISAASHLRYEQDFNRFYGPIAKQKIRSFNASDLCDYIEEQEARLNMTARAFSNLKCITKGMFKRAYRKGWIDFRVEEEVLQVIDLSDRAFKKNYKEDFQEVYTEDEFTRYTKFLSETPDIWNLGLLLMFVTGLRGGEIVALSFDDIEDHGDFFVLHVRHTETRYKNTKGKYVYDVKDAPKTDAGIRHAIVPRQFYWIYAELIKHKNDWEYVFSNPADGSRFTTNSLRRRQELNNKKLGIYQKSPHKNRKTYGTIILDNKLDNNLILGQMGHTNISTTERFYHRNMKQLEKKAEIISSIDIFGA